MIIYEGPSEIDNKPIAVIMTGTKTPSMNIKTGTMAQTYILLQDISPIDAVKSKEDYSICGSCIHRGSSCYVNLAHGPTMVWKAYKNNSYERCPPSKAGYNQSIRVGAYGDPGAVPKDIWKKLLSKARMWTGYTHQTSSAMHLMGNVQASADTAEEAIALQAIGWKTFRVKTPDEPLLPGEIMCPNEKTGMQCIQCGLCNGRQKNIAINIHGAAYRINNYKTWRLSTQ